MPRALCSIRRYVGKLHNEFGTVTLFVVSNKHFNLRAKLQIRNRIVNRVRTAASQRNTSYRYRSGHGRVKGMSGEISGQGICRYCDDLVVVVRERGTLIASGKWLVRVSGKCSAVRTTRVGEWRECEGSI